MTIEPILTDHYLAGTPNVPVQWPEEAGEASGSGALELMVGRRRDDWRSGRGNSIARFHAGHPYHRGGGRRRRQELDELLCGGLFPGARGEARCKHCGELQVSRQGADQLDAWYRKDLVRSKVGMSPINAVFIPPELMRLISAAWAVPANAMARPI